MRLLSSQRSLRSRPRQTHARSYKCDESTGQVYVETTFSIPKVDDRNWPWQSRRPPLKSPVQVARTDHGPRSLRATATDIVLRNISFVTVDDLRFLPALIVMQMWKEIVNQDMLTLESFKLFSKVLAKDSSATLDLLRYRQNILQPQSPIDMYKTPITSTSFEFLSSLVIDTLVPMPELVALSSITNLATLTIVKSRAVPQNDVGDRLIRAWHLAADAGAFPVLRLLSLQGFPELTSHSLSFLNSFPALALYIVSGCSFDAELSQILAQKIGWQTKYNKDILHILEALCSKRAIYDQDGPNDDPRSHESPSFGEIVDSSRIQWVPRGQLDEYRRQIVLRAPPVSISAVKRENIEDLKPIRKGRQMQDSKIIVRSESGKEFTPSSKSFKQQLRRKHGLVSQRGPCGSMEIINLFTRLGELRKDADLTRAGVSIGDQAMVGSMLVNSVPMISLRLGWNSCNEASCGDSLCFMRLEQQDEDSSKARIPFPSSSQRRPKRPPCGVIRRGKKQKLESVLGFSPET